MLTETVRDSILQQRRGLVDRLYVFFNTRGSKTKTLAFKLHNKGILSTALIRNMDAWKSHYHVYLSNSCFLEKQSAVVLH